jgi:tetratricopeptide (TPR) repeat protein
MAQLISIQERGEVEGGWQVVVRFNNGQEHSIKVSNPFSDEEERELEWYFEEHLAFPFTKRVHAHNAAQSIPVYGEKLFHQIFAKNAQVLLAYKHVLQAGLHDVQIEIEGSPAFHSLHWEALKDPEVHTPLVLQATMARKNLAPSPVPAQVRLSPTINLLIVTARPSGQHDVGYRTISRPLVEALSQTTIPIKIDILRPGTFQALEQHLAEMTTKYGRGHYHVIHFDVHGAVFNKKAFLFFDRAQDNSVGSIKATELAHLLRHHQVPIVILNACQSGKQIGDRETSLGSHLIQEGVQLVLAMSYSVTVSAAKLLMSTLYTYLSAGEDLQIAIREARTELYTHKERRAYFGQHIELEDWLLPVVYQNAPVTLQPREFTPQERAAWVERKAEEKNYTPPEPIYGFVGRDLDILQIEKCLLTKRNILLIRGMSGVGKTTLLRYLRAWWHTTGFVEQTFSFSYDEKAWTLQQILTEIATQLYGPGYSTDIQPYPLAQQQARIAQRLRAEQHLLILDNLESITGAYLAIRHTLPEEEQDALRSFVSDLARGKTRVLLGSRGGEAWLVRDTFEDNVYDLPGLDEEAASLLIDRILAQCHATKYRPDEHLTTLIKLLDGFPLAMEVVLANLARKGPQEILEALQAGDVKIDPRSDSQEKTVSILRCIDYSYRNLSPEAQQLLLCLAPFTSVFRIDYLDHYTGRLKEQPMLAHLSFDRWSEVLREAQNWGLLSPHDVSGFLHMQPTFAYFLRNRLHEMGQAAVREAIETAFREYYDEIGAMLYRLLRSKEPQERQVGQVLTGLEYENLVTALHLALAARVWISHLSGPLSKYLDATQDHRRGLELGQIVMQGLEAYLPEELTGIVSTDVVGEIGDIANRQLALKQYAAAEQSYQKALSIWLENTSYNADAISKVSAPIYHQLGTVALERHQWSRAEQYYQQALQIYIEYNDRSKQAGSYHQLGRVAQGQRQWQQAEQYYQQALQIYIENNDRYEQMLPYHELGSVAQEQRRWQQAEQYYQQALQILIEYNDRYEQAPTYHQLGIVAQEQREWQRAEYYYQQALQIRIEFNDHYSQAGTYHQLGRVAEEQQQWQQAEQYYQQTLQLYMGFNDHFEQARISHHLGTLAQEQQQWQQAEQYFRQALQIKIEYNDRYSQARTYHQLGRVTMKQRKFQQAEHYYQQALQIYIEFNNRYEQAITYGQLGLLAQDQQQWQQAGDYLLQALPIFVEDHEDDNADIALYRLAQLWKTNDDASLPARVAKVLEMSVGETEKVLQEELGEQEEK